MEVEPEDREKTAFSVPWGHYECNRMPFGLVNSPATWQRLMNAVLSGLTGEHCFVYLDDIICFSKNDVKEHLAKLETILEILRQAGLTLNWGKCQFMKPEVEYLGHIVSKAGLKPDPSKVEAIKRYPTPKSVTEIRAFLGLVGYYRRLIIDFAKIAHPLTALTKKNVRYEWSEECQQAFDTLRLALTEEPILQYPNLEKPFSLFVDASGYALGAVLCQEKDGHELPVAYASRQLNRAEMNYCTTERECLAMLWGIKQYRCYLFGNDFTVYTDHEHLKWLVSVKDPSNRLMRWSLALSEYSFTIK